MDGLTKERFTVLVVDDVRENVRLLSSILATDYGVQFALNGDDALKKVGANPPDLVLLDVEMPGIDGHEVLRRMKSDAGLAKIPVIFVTGRSDVSDEETGLELGAVDYISKPFNPSIVRARVRSHLLLREQARKLEVANFELERLATTDTLTGLLNRRAFFERADAENARKARYGGISAVIAFDIDHFKKVNDTWGHAAGDVVLTAFAHATKECLRLTDSFGRIGGEEFCVLAPNTDHVGAKALAERILEAIRKKRIKAKDLEISITVSAGVSELHDGERDFSLALARADEALYQAKHNGRDRCEIIL